MQLKHIVLSLAALSASGLCVAAQNSDSSVLPVVERQGVRYYEYTVKDGDSLYGVAKLFGWDYDLLDSVNPGAAARMYKGRALYYPAEEDASAPISSPAAESGRDGKVTYTLTGTASPYEVAKLLGVTTEQLYAQNPAARRGLNKGDVVAIDYSALESAVPEKTGDVSPADTSRKSDGNIAESVADKFSRHTVVMSQEDDPYSSPSTRNPLVGLDTDMLMEYTIQPGDNPALVAHNFNTTVRDIFFLNRGVSEYRFPEGSVINILPSSKEFDHRTAAIKTRYKSGEITYKVKEGDTWQSVADTYGVTADELREANPKRRELKKGNKIVVPQFSISTEWRDVVFTDPREETAEGRKAIHKEVNAAFGPEKSSGNEFDIVVLTSTAADDAKRDRDFLRGFLMGVNSVKTGGRKLGVQVIDVTDRQLPLLYLSDITCGRPDVVIATYEKDFPAALADYGLDSNAAIVNVFDAKSEEYGRVHDFFQVLMPSAMMNESIAAELLRRSEGKDVVFVYDDSEDVGNYTAQMKRTLASAGRSFLDMTGASSLGEMELTGSDGCMIVSNAQSYSEIRATLNSVVRLREAYPGVPVSVVGRPSWIVYADKLDELMRKSDTYIPSRFFYDEDDATWQRFAGEFRSHYNVEPAASFPPYAALGYDVARYFIESLLVNEGDFNRKVDVSRGVEMNLDFERATNHSGFINKTLYLMHYSDNGVEGIQFR